MMRARDGTKGMGPKGGDQRDGTIMEGTKGRERGMGTKGGGEG